MKAFYTLLILLIPFVGVSQTVNINTISSDSSEEQSLQIFYEDFANGLDGNNNSSNPTWTTQGPDGSIWELDYDGSNGEYASLDTNFLFLQSESASNGWMIFDADFSNTGSGSPENRKGSLTSPNIDLSNHNYISLSFEHAFRWCCLNNHELRVFVNNGSGWSVENSFQVNNLGNPNTASGTINVNLNISEIAGGYENVQLRFDWANGEETASHYYWMIDDVKIIQQEEFSLEIIDAYNTVPSTYFFETSYSVMPFEQISQTSYFFGGLSQNTGYSTIDSLRVYAVIDSLGYFDSSYGTLLSSFGLETQFVNNGFNPSNIGDFSANIFFKDDFENVFSDTIIQSFSVSDFIYARDDYTDGDSLTGSYITDYLYFEGSYERGNVFDIYADAMLYGIKVRIHPETSPGCMAKGVLNMVDVETGDFSFLTETSEMSVGSMTDDWINFVFDVPVPLLAGQVVLPTIQYLYDGINTLVVAESGNSQTGESLVCDIDGVAGDPGEWYFTSSTPMVRLNFDPSLIIEGCIDEMACNYNSNANTDDGSCLYPTSNEETYSACNEFNWNGELYTQSGEFTYVTSGSNGCDSITTLNLTITNSINVNLDITSCDEYSWQGEMYTESGTYMYETVNENGCDSVVNLNLSIVGGLESQTIIGQDEVEPFSSHIYALTLNENIYGWSVTNGNILSDNGNNIEVLWGEAGIGLIEVVETDENGCTITHSLQVNLGNNVENSWNCVNEACVDPLDGSGEYGSLNDCEANCTVVIEDSWNCVNDACVDPLDGSGEYGSLNDCEANCSVVIEDSWNCLNDACVDPLDGSGEYGSLNDCEQECQNISSINENLIDVNIYPNPSSNIFNLDLNSDSEAEIAVTNILGEQVYIESTKSIGEFNTQIDLSNYSKGIYNLTIKTSDGISNHKLILQ
jgi:hypothetical protein